MTDDFDLDPVSPVHSILTPETEPNSLDVKTTNSLENIDQLRQFRTEKIKEIYHSLRPGQQQMGDWKQGPLAISAVPGAEASKESADGDGLISLARATFQKHLRKTGGQAKLIGSYRIAQLGARRFAAFDFSTNGGSLRTRCAVCVSSIGNHYEIAVAPLTVTGKDVPDPLEQERVFRSILATVQY